MTFPNRHAHLIFAAALAGAVGAQDPTEAVADKSKSDRELVHGVVSDYLTAIYEVKPELIDKSVAEDLVKFGFWRDGDDQPYRGLKMTFSALRNLAATWNKTGTSAGEDSPKDIEILDVMPHVACAKLTAEWGVDYMQLIKRDGKWQIVHVIWQKLPEQKVDEKVRAKDEKAVIAAATDYADAYYQSKPEYVKRSVHSSLAKKGIAEQDGKQTEKTMTHAQLVELAAKSAEWVPPKDEQKKDVEVLDLLDQTATVKLEGSWGVDYMNLAKFDDTWQIVHVVWQIYPKAEK